MKHNKKQKQICVFRAQLSTLLQVGSEIVIFTKKILDKAAMRRDTAIE